MKQFSVDIPRTVGKDQAEVIKDEFTTLGWTIGATGFLPDGTTSHIRTLLVEWHKDCEPVFPDGKDELYTIEPAQ